MAECQQKPFLNPCPPFSIPLFGGLQEGKSIIVIGRVLPNTNRFSVELQCGSYNGADIALQISPNFDDDACIVCNTCEKGSWGPEENSDSPLLKGQAFTLEIHVTQKAYKISVNGQHVTNYKHRFPFTRVDTVTLLPMVALDFIAYQKPATVQPVPYKTLINDGLQPGKDIIVHGLLNIDAKRIEFNLRHIFGVAFHYKWLFEENVVVRNTLENGSWGPVEKDGPVPFVPGQFFQVKISCNRDHYDVFVNGQEIHTYKHRFTKLEDIDVFQVRGDLQLVFVHV